MLHLTSFFSFLPLLLCSIPGHFLDPAALGQSLFLVAASGCRAGHCSPLYHSPQLAASLRGGNHISQLFFIPKTRSSLHWGLLAHTQRLQKDETTPKLPGLWGPPWDWKLAVVSTSLSILGHQFCFPESAVKTAKTKEVLLLLE